MPAAAPAEPPSRPVPRRRRTFSCSHCREPLPLPSSAASRRRTPFLVCPRCARRTPVPTLRRRLIQIMLVILVLAAWTFVILTFIREG